MFLEIVIFNNLINSNTSLFVSVVCLLHIKEFVVLKSGYKKDVVRKIINDMYNAIFKYMLYCFLISLFRNSMCIDAPKKIAFYFVYRFMNLSNFFPL
jgi:hypothetical protein